MQSVNLLGVVKTFLFIIIPSRRGQQQIEADYDFGVEELAEQPHIPATATATYTNVANHRNSITLATNSTNLFTCLSACLLLMRYAYLGQHSVLIRGQLLYECYCT